MEKNNKMVVEGYAIVFNQPTVLWEYEGKKIYEVIDPRSLDNCDLSDVCFKYNHSDEVLIVASVKNGTLKLDVDKIGLKIRASLVNTTVGKDLYEMIKTKLLTKMSFAFAIEEDHYDKDTSTRVVRKIKRLFDVSAVTNPAYPQTNLYCVDNENLESLRVSILNTYNSDREVERIKRNIKESSKLELEKLKIKIKYKI